MKNELKDLVQCTDTLQQIFHNKEGQLILPDKFDKKKNDVK